MRVRLEIWFYLAIMYYMLNLTVCLLSTDQRQPTSFPLQPEQSAKRGEGYLVECHNCR
jgi:hypothetical protein